MDFYLDEQLPKRVANALNELEGHYERHSILSTEISFGKGIKDPDLFKLLKEANGIFITNDLKILTRRSEFQLLKELGVTAFMLSFPSGSSYWFKVKVLINKWEEIKSISETNRHPFICKIKMKGQPEYL